MSPRLMLGLGFVQHNIFFAAFFIPNEIYNQVISAFSNACDLKYSFAVGRSAVHQLVVSLGV